MVGTDNHYLRSVIDSIEYESSGSIAAYIVTALQEYEVEDDEKCQLLLLTNVDTGDTYSLPEEFDELTRKEQELYGIMHIPYEADTECIDNELLIEEVKLKCARFPGRYSMRCYSYRRAVTQVALTKQAALSYVADTKLKDPHIERVDLYDISADIHALISCFVRGRRCGALREVRNDDIPNDSYLIDSGSTVCV